MLFTISLVLFYSSAQRRGTSSEESNVEYIAGADIPILYANMLGYKMNAMRGYISPMGSDIAYDTLTLLPEDRKLVLSIEGNRLQISSVSYEVRTVDLTGLIERTEVTDFSGGGTSFDITLPIQNLLAPNT